MTRSKRAQYIEHFPPAHRPFVKAHARQVARRRGQRTCLFSGHSERLVHARVVAVFHRIVACGVVVGRAGRQGRRADGLLDDWLLLERVERRRVWQDPLERAPCVAPGPARKTRSTEPPRRRGHRQRGSGGAWERDGGGAGRRVSGVCYQRIPLSGCFSFRSATRSYSCTARKAAV